LAETSGVIVAARTRDAWEKLRAAFSDGGEIEKHYLALVNGPLADAGEIDVPLAHAGAGEDPLVGGVYEPLEVLVGQHFRRQAGPQPDDPGSALMVVVHATPPRSRSCP